MAVDGEKLYTQLELEEIVRRRQSDQERLIQSAAERAVSAIRPEFGAVNARLDAQTLQVNARLDDLTFQVKKTNGTVDDHAKLFADFGAPGMSQEQRRMLAPLLEDALEDGHREKANEQRQRRRFEWGHFVIQTVSSVTASIGVAVAVLAYLHTRGII